jgi:hypothetical protein
MASHLNVLSFRPRIVQATERQRRFLRSALPAKHEDVFLDFLIDGRPLREVLEVPEDVRRPTDDVSDLSESSAAEAVLQVDRLLGVAPNQYGSERVWLLFCPVCHEEGCGGLSVKVDRRDGQVEWSNFAWDNIFENPPTILSLTQRFVFDAVAYDTALGALRARFATLTV